MLKRWRSLVLLAIGAFVAGIAWAYSDPEPRFGSAVLRHPIGAADSIFDRVLPPDLDQTIAVLDGAGFKEAHRLAGHSYRRLPVPEGDDANAPERSTILFYNRLLDDHGATIIKTYRRRVERFAYPDPWITVYVLVRPDGTKAHRARAWAPAVFGPRRP